MGKYSPDHRMLDNAKRSYMYPDSLPSLGEDWWHGFRVQGDIRMIAKMYINHRLYRNLEVAETRQYEEVIRFILPKYSEPKTELQSFMHTEDRFHEIHFVHCGLGVYHTQVEEFIESLAFDGLM
jgi:hypothetical protein